MMQAHGQPSGRHGQIGRVPTGGVTSSVNPALAERARLAAIRRSTPDSEALASSDEEHDLVKSTHSLSSNPGSQYPPARRTSWLSEIHSGLPRRPSVTTTTSNTSQPATPSSEHAAWPFGSQLGRVASNPAAANWSSSGLWSAEARREASTRLPTLPSPGGYGALSSTQARNMSEERSAGSPLLFTDPSFPFTIPLQPTPKTYRSQSYSVGQMEEETPASPGAAQGGVQNGARAPPTSQQVLLHRPSRPSMLSEVTEGTSMAALREENDDDDLTEPDAGVPLPPRAGILRSPQMGNLHTTLNASTRVRNRASTADNSHPAALRSMQPYNEAVIDESDDAETATDLLESRFGALAGFGTQSGDSSRRGLWQTSLGFGDLETIPQSRRHSLADIPTRRNSLSAAAANEQAVFSPSAGNAAFTSASTAMSPAFDVFNHASDANAPDRDDRKSLQTNSMSLRTNDEQVSAINQHETMPGLISPA